MPKQKQQFKSTQLYDTCSKIDKKSSIEKALNRIEMFEKEK